jgi:hypothetical protein
VATLFKALFGAFLGAIFLPEGVEMVVFSSKFWIELGLNALLAPFLFGILKLFKMFQLRDKGGFV